MQIFLWVFEFAWNSWKLMHREYYHVNSRSVVVPNLKSSLNFTVTGCVRNRITIRGLTNHWTTLFCFLAILQCVSIKSLHFSKVPPYKYFKIFSGNFHTCGMGLFYQMIPKNLMMLYAWVSRSHICEIDQNPGLTGIGICSVCYQQNWESWKGFKIIILKVWWHFMKICFVVCIFWHMPSTFYASSSYYLLYWAFWCVL